MFDDKRIEVRSIEQLISSLEPIEEFQLQSDVRANVRCELRRMRKNISAVLAFVSRLPDAAETDQPEEFRQAVNAVRRKCLLINGMITKSLLLQSSPLSLRMCIRYTSKVMDQYGDLAQAARQMCRMAAPHLTEDLARAL
jgi:hypothetical protein